MAGRTVSIRVAGMAVLCLALALAVVRAQPAGEEQERDAPPVFHFSGGDLYKTYCAVCHGRSAKGDGPLAASMKRTPPDLTLFAQRNGGTYPSELVRKIIDGREPLTGHGGRDMPAWGDAFKESRGGLSEEAVQARIEALVKYLETVQVRNARQSGETQHPAAP